ncbi:MAG: glycine zipper 2TM domain-containing protein [Burkholderiales bacterium]|nr:glycine zipper 2TM domain-containing protein [Burkholderiales bacterium]
MDSLTPKAQRLHPLIAAAAISVIALSGVDTLAILNSRVNARHSDPAASAMALTATPAAIVAPAPAAAVAAGPAPAPIARAERPVAKPTPKPRAVPVSETPAPVARAPIVTPPIVEAMPVPRSVAPPVIAPAPVCMECGTVVAVREIKEPGRGSGLGAVAGAVLGGVIGNQVGDGSGRQVARVLGAVGGAVAGHQVEKHARTSAYYLVDVRMDDGSLQTVRRDAAPLTQAGERVRVQGGQLRGSDGSTIASRAAPVTEAPIAGGA